MVFPGATRCPRCGGMLLMPHEAVPSAPVLSEVAPPAVEGQAVRRLAVGLGLALASYAGLRELWQLIPRLLHLDAAAWLASVPGLLSLYGMQTIAVTLGALVAAAARSHGYTHGLLVGLASGGLFFLWELQQEAALRQAPVLLQIPLVAWVGLLAGWLAERIWPPPPVIELPRPRSSLLSSLQFARQSLAPAIAPPPTPTRWFRILFGAVVGVALLLWADQIRLGIQRYSLGLFQAQTAGHASFLSWLIAAFGLLLGGVLAAAGTSAGLRHGLFAGLLAAPVVLGFALQHETLPPPLEYALTRLGLAGVPLSDPVAAAAVLGGILSLCTLGGWFGAALFPPLAPAASRRVRPVSD